MNNAHNTDPVFREAVAAIDAGDLSKLQHILADGPGLMAQRLPHPIEGYFRRPYLLWFIANNPIRQEQLPSNILAITRFLVETARQAAPATFQLQIDYALELVATGRIMRDCGVQIDTMDLLLDAGAKPGTGIAALANGNVEAAAHLVEHGSGITLAAAAGLGRENDAKKLLRYSCQDELDLALVIACFFGRTGLIKMLMEAGANVNAYPSAESGFHSHANALHQAVYAGSMEAVTLLLAGGADPKAKDKIYDGTPLDWAEHLQTDKANAGKLADHAAIEAFLRTLS